ncbi:hypothetical protein Hanom_Chr15g01384891 [Helianthus anomalus]
MRALNCIKRLQRNLIRHLILSQSLLTRQLRSWTETALSFNAGSLCARAQVTLVRVRPCAVHPLGSLPCAHAPRHHARCVLLAQVHARVRHVMRRIPYHLVLATLVLHHARAVKNTKAALKRPAAMRACEVQSAPSKRHIAPHRARACECKLGCSAPFARSLVCASMKQ